MSKGRGVEDQAVEDEEMEGNEFDGQEYEEEYEEEGEEDYLANGYQISEEVYDNICNTTIGPWIVSDVSRPDKIRRRGTSQFIGHNNWVFSSSGHGRLDLNIKPQDADYCPDLPCSDVPYLSGELGAVMLPTIPHEVETMILARIPFLELRNLCSLNKRILTLVKSGELVRERKTIGVQEASVFMLASGENNWWAFDQQFMLRKTLTNLPSDETFKMADKESLCAGTHLLVFGKEYDGPAVWIYEVLHNRWIKGASMNEPRCLFASASSGDFAYVAGGTCLETNGILNSAEKYDPETKSWERLPKMKQKRRMCAGVYMDNKFHVIGGQNQTGEALTCAEVFHERNNTWVRIPGLLKGLTTSDSPPLVAVVNDELYIFETSTNCLMVYLKNSNTWKDLGPIPVRADIGKGWGVAFKSLGNELLAIGGSNISPYGRGMTIYTCCPNPNAETLEWKLLDDGRNSRSPFVMNCTVMVA